MRIASYLVTASFSISSTGWWIMQSDDLGRQWAVRFLWWRWCPWGCGDLLAVSGMWWVWEGKGKKELYTGSLHALRLMLCCLVCCRRLLQCVLRSLLTPVLFSFLTVFMCLRVFKLLMLQVRRSFCCPLSSVLVYFSIFVGGLFVSFCVPSSFSSFVFIVGFLPPSSSMFFLLLFVTAPSLTGSLCPC